MNHIPDIPHHEHPDVAGGTRAWCSKCERDAEDCTCDNYGYPSNWPKCPSCGLPALDGHITCGRAECNEGEMREAPPPNCEWFDNLSQLDDPRDFNNLPKPPEPLPWLPQKKATDRHPFA